MGLINGKICWKNITHNMNKTNIIFFTQRLSQNFYINIDNRVTPLVEREYITFYQIIISGKISYNYVQGATMTSFIASGQKQILLTSMRSFILTIILLQLTKYFSR